MVAYLPIITYFIIYSFLGWILESTYKSVLQKRIVNSGFLHGPLCPIYGYGAMIMYLSLKNMQNNIVILFFFGLIVLSIFEYAVSWLLEMIFKTKYWDYSKKFCNIHGRVCLQNSLYWGALGIVFMKIIHPIVENLVELIPTQYNLIITYGILATMTADTVNTVIGLIKINVKLKTLEEISANIKAKIDEVNRRNAVKLEKIKEQRYRAKEKIANNSNVLGELRRRQEFYQKLLEKRIRRLKRAFPSMQSERLTNFFFFFKKYRKDERLNILYNRRQMKKI